MDFHATLPGWRKLAAQRKAHILSLLYSNLSCCQFCITAVIQYKRYRNSLDTLEQHECCTIGGFLQQAPTKDEHRAALFFLALLFYEIWRGCITQIQAIRHTHSRGSLQIKWAEMAAFSVFREVNDQRSHFVRQPKLMPNHLRTGLMELLLQIQSPTKAGAIMDKLIS